MLSLIVVVAVGAAVAGFVQGLSGFAFALVATSIWAWTVEPHLALSLAMFGGLTGQVIAAVTVRRGFKLPLLLPFLVGGLVGIPIGVAVVPRIDVDVFKTCLGALLVVWCPLMLLSKRLPQVRFGGRIGSRLADGAAGLIGGVLGGIGGLAGPIPTLWCTLRGMDKDTQRVVIQNFNLAVLAVSMATSIATGVVTRDMLPLFGVVLPAMLIPTLIGTRVYVGISEATFRAIVLSLLSVSGVALLMATLPRLLPRFF